MKIDITAILFVVLVAISCVLTGGLVLILGVVFGLLMFILIRALGRRVGRLLLGYEYKSFIIAKKAGGKACVMYKSDYRMEHKGFYGAVNVAIRITWIGLGFGLLLMRYFIEKFSAAIEQGIKTIGVGEIVMVGLIASILGTLLSPMAVPYWAINSSRIRVVNLRNGTISLPGSFLRSLFKVLGAGNIAVFAYFIMAAINVVGDISEGIKIAFIALVFVFGCISVAGLIASIILLFKGGGILNSTLDEYEEKYSNEAIDPNEFISIMKQYLPEIEVKPPEEEDREEKLEVEAPPEEEVPEELAPEAEAEVAETEEPTEEESAEEKFGGESGDDI